MTDEHSFAGVAALIRLISDPNAHGARLAELRTTIADADTRKAEANAAAAQLDHQREQLADREKKVRAREVEVRMLELKNRADLDRLDALHREQAQDRLVKVGSSGLTREPDTSSVPPDPHMHDRRAEPMKMPATRARA